MGEDLRVVKTKRAVEGAMEKLLAELPEALRDSYRPLLAPEHCEEVSALLKAADKLSAHIKCLEEQKAGNTEFDSAAEQAMASMKASPNLGLLTTSAMHKNTAAGRTCIFSFFHIIMPRRPRVQIKSDL